MATEYDSVLLIIKAIIGAVVLVAIIFYVLGPLFKGLSSSSVDNRMVRSRPNLNHRLQDEELEIPTSRPTEVSNQMIIKKALDDPVRTTQLVRNWLRDKKKPPIDY